MAKTLIAGSHVVTMNAARDIIRHGAVVVDGDRIVDVGKAAELESKFGAADATQAWPHEI